MYKESNRPASALFSIVEIRNVLPGIGLLLVLASTFLLTGHSAFAASCGGEGQKGCKITFKRLKTCDKGLRINLKSKRCVRNKFALSNLPIKVPPKVKPKPRKKVVACGGLEQRGCKPTLARRMKACDKGLVLNPKNLRCHKLALKLPKLPKLPKLKPPPKQTNCGGVGQTKCRITVLQPTRCKFGLKYDRNKGTCERLIGAIRLPPKQTNCGALGQQGCRMTALRLKSCDVPLKRNKNTGICEHGKFFRPKDKNCGQLNQRACRPTATRLKACDFGLRKNRDTGLCELGKVISARQHGCGSLNQVPCQITGTRLKACDFGYKRNEDHTKCIHGGLTLRPVSPHCGAQEQRACKKTEALFSCKTKDLRRDPQTGLCKLKANKKELKRRAKQILQEETGGLIKVMFAMQKCLKGDPMALINPDFQKFADKADLVKRAIKDKDVNIAIALMMSGCAEPLLEAAEHGNYETVTIGITGGGGVIVGGFIDQGFAFHVSSLRDFVNDPVNHAFPTPTYYQTKSVSVGVQAGASAGISMGLYKDAARVADLRGADTQGYTFEAIGAVGASVGVWFKYGAEYDGISAAAVVGVEGGAGAYNRLNTAIVSLDKPETNTINCGGPNQRACKLWENPMICEQGLEHNFEKSLCEAPASQTQQVQFVQTSTGNGLDCGANGQRVCRVQEQIPGCNPGLVINFQAKVCARP